MLDPQLDSKSRNPSPPGFRVQGLDPKSELPMLTQAQDHLDREKAELVKANAC